MARNPDESQGQNADPETHASGIHSINDLDAGLVENDEERKEKGGEDEEGADHAYEKPDEKRVCDERNFYGGTGGRFAILADEDVVENARLSGENDGEDIPAPACVGERLDQGNGDATEGSEYELHDYEEEDEEEVMDNEEAIPDKNEGPKTNDEDNKGDDEYWVGKGNESPEDKIWNKLNIDISQVPPCLNVKEVELMHGCDTQQAGMEMVHGLRLQDYLQTMSRRRGRLNG